MTANLNKERISIDELKKSSIITEELNNEYTQNLKIIDNVENKKLVSFTSKNFKSKRKNLFASLLFQQRKFIQKLNNKFNQLTGYIFFFLIKYLILNFYNI